ncbi:MAG TPA: 4Fe-4S dicluster domain-containing protein [bacterium]|nr:4Fe-4S dicluster domain-containing protein [bacterium]
METLYISKKDWDSFIKGKCAGNIIFAPFENGSSLFYGKADAFNYADIVYDRARPVEPLRMFLLPFRERVVPEPEKIPDIVVMGAAACDLKGLEILDNVFLKSEYKDQNYAKRRNKTLLISFDCLAPYPTCFCELVGVHPYPEAGFDINISLSEEGILADVGSEKGMAFIGNDQKFFQASGEQVKKREEQRKKTVETLKESNRSYDFTRIDRMKGLSQTELWKVPREVENCVQCGSCTNNCPTCVCFLLEDTGNSEMLKKNKVWDSCLFPGYARMAAGASPRATLYDRYSNRLLCKYWYMVENFGIKGCTGCGRCIAGCIGKIDKRAVITEVLREKR